MPRQSRKRGKQVKKRGISKEQVCIATAIYRQGNLIMELACKGRITSNELETLYDGHITNGSILCTDSHKSYMQFANDLSLEHKRIKRRENMENIKIKKADLEDLELIGNLFNKYRIFYGQDSNLESSKKFIEERMIHNESVIFIIMKDSIIPLGFVQLYPSFSSVSMKRIWILNDLYVEESARKKGIGKSLMNKAKEFAFETGAKGLTLSTAIDNTTAQKLYEQSGYKRNEMFYHYSYFF